MAIGLFIGNDKIGELTESMMEVPLEFTTVDPDSYTFYLRRSGWYYFRNHFRRVSFTADDIPEELKNLKYGDVVKLKY